MMVVPLLALIIEDDEFQRETLIEFLKGEGIDVISCESAEAAELIVGRIGAELSLIVTDFRLAGPGTGADLAAFAKRRFPYLRVILMSGDHHAPVPPDVRFLRKPFALPDLLAFEDHITR